MNYEYVDFSVLIGKTLVSVENVDDERIIFKTTEGETYKMLHFQDCCESVTVEDICGNLSDLVGRPILNAEMVSREGEETDFDTSTWTFYHISTIKGYVTIRWFGQSNGYYSESVDFIRLISD
jgi:hypothetical protein